MLGNAYRSILFIPNCKRRLIIKHALLPSESSWAALIEEEATRTLRGGRVIHVYRPLRSDRILHKVNFLRVITIGNEHGDLSSNPE